MLDAAGRRVLLDVIKILKEKGIVTEEENKELRKKLIHSF